jgi:sulfur relay (sulfurtransferase) complex TusBCD TusD component (DsrE family)
MKGTVVIVTKPGLGTTRAEDSEFGSEMLDKFFHTLEQQAEKPAAICFYTEGVKAAVAGSPIEISLKLLARLGVRVIICETCLRHYGIELDSAIGNVGGMKEIMQALAEAEKVITI